MSQYPAVYNQNTGDDDKEGGMGMDLGLDDDKDQAKSSGDKYADGDQEANIEPTKKWNAIRIISDSVIWKIKM